ncbi:hypothetical protein [Neobacillus niacini]|uniref:hypothetical protein n=1 Tax=Neobacillus niacini TaxID=86668 RepID=UPI0021CB74D9|nr:hypothetical protein [Neobacillus niacini]MCM3768771.1 hypothetical protein [Neobacillus niacini]
MKNTKLRVAWIVPNALCYLIFIGFSIFIALNTSSLQEKNLLSIWIFAMVVLLLISIFGSYRIWSWIKEGKM